MVDGAITRFLLGLSLLALVAACGPKATSGKWLDYGSGMINLDNVTRMKYGIKNEVGPLGRASQRQFMATLRPFVENKSNKRINDITRLTLEEWKKHAGGNQNYSLTISTYLAFDNFTLTLEKTNVTSFKEFSQSREGIIDAYNDIATS